jgi:hypothetical protein
MRSANGIVLLAVLMTFVGWIRAKSLIAQDSVQRPLIGAWEGTLTQEGSPSATTRLEFSEKDGKLLWRWSWHASFGKGEAEGIVTKYEPPSVEMSGRYTLHPISTIENSPITMSLTVVGTSMQGNGLTSAVNRVFSVSVMKK